MRVILEMSEAEHQAVSVERRVLGSGAVAGPAPTATATAIDGGTPPPALLSALGGEAGEAAAATDAAVERPGATSAGSAPDWLAEILGRGRA